MTTLRHFALVVLFVTVTFASQNVVYKCEPVNLTTCATGWQFRVTGGYETKQLNYTVCTNTSATCTVGVSHTFNMQTCAIDFKGDACSTGICFMYPVFQICAKSILTCPNSFTVNYSCINCANTAGCVKCVNKITTNPGQTATTSQSCLGANCTEGFSPTDASFEPCTLGYDVMREPCPCCVRTTQISRFCTNNNWILNTDQVKNWFVSIQGSQIRLSHVVGMIMVIVAAFFY